MSYTTSCKLDLDKALIKSIQVLNDGGRWKVRHRKLQKDPITPKLDGIPQEPFETNISNFEQEFNEAERIILRDFEGYRLKQ